MDRGATEPLCADRARWEGNADQRGLPITVIALQTAIECIDDCQEVGVADLILSAIGTHHVA
jgi:hypothetical protein